jgi:hypothetical protein
VYGRANFSSHGQETKERKELGFHYSLKGTCPMTSKVSSPPYSAMFWTNL